MFKLEKKRAIMIWGPPGIGKSRLVADTASILEIRLEDQRLSQFDPADIRGLVDILNHTKTTWKPPDWLPDNGAGIVFLDEINLAPPSVQASAYQLVLDRKVGNYKLPDEWMVVAAGNRIGDRANVFPLAKPLANRMAHVYLKPPNDDDWLPWAVDNQIDPRQIAFIKCMPSALFKFDPDSAEDAFPTPRTNELASDMIKPYPDASPDRLQFLEAPWIGMGMAIQFAGFMKMTEKVDFQAILEGKEDLPDRDLYYPMISECAMYLRKKKTEDTLEKIINLAEKMSTSPQYKSPEFAITMLSLAKAIDPDWFIKKSKPITTFKKYADHYVKFLIPST